MLERIGLGRPVSLRHSQEARICLTLAGAKAVSNNVTSTATTAPSFLAVVPGNVTESAVSSLNWSGSGVSIANAGIVGIDSNRDVAIIAGPGGTFESIIDITGYFL